MVCSGFVDTLPLTKPLARFTTFQPQKFWRGPVLIVFIIATVLTVLPLFFMFVTWLIGQISGWSRLASSFRTEAPVSGKVLRMQSAKIGLASYNGCLTICVLESGLRLSMLLPFRCGHPPLLIPWHQVHNVQETTYGFRKFISMSIGEPRMTTLLLPAKISEQLPST